MKISERNKLKERILGFIKEAKIGGDAEAQNLSFNRLALDLFAFQYSANPAYSRLCRRRGASPATIHSWREIPAVMTTSFKHVELFCGDAQRDARHIFLTSGTTKQIRGKHFLRELDLYKAGAMRFFKEACLPDVASIPVLVLGPSAEVFPNSSLGQMFSWIVEDFGADESICAFGENGVDAAAAKEWLRRTSRENSPVLILATSLALLTFVENPIFHENNLRLSKGSRIVDTGGYKATGREIERENFLGKISQAFGLATEWIFNEYGMTELSSQFYESVFTRNNFGVPYKMSPPWMKSIACHPETLEPLKSGEEGVLRHFDLANLDSVAMIQTEDVGVVHESGVELLGRDPASEPRGCSMLAEEFLRESGM